MLEEIASLYGPSLDVALLRRMMGDDVNDAAHTELPDGVILQFVMPAGPDSVPHSSGATLAPVQLDVTWAANMQCRAAPTTGLVIGTMHSVRRREARRRRAELKAVARALAVRVRAEAHAAAAAAKAAAAVAAVEKKAAAAAAAAARKVAARKVAARKGGDSASVEVADARVDGGIEAEGERAFGSEAAVGMSEDDAQANDGGFADVGDEEPPAATVITVTPGSPSLIPSLAEAPDAPLLLLHTAAAPPERRRRSSEASEFSGNIDEYDDDDDDSYSDGSRSSDSGDEDAFSVDAGAADRGAGDVSCGSGDGSAASSTVPSQVAAPTPVTLASPEPSVYPRGNIVATNAHGAILQPLFVTIFIKRENGKKHHSREHRVAACS